MQRTGFGLVQHLDRERMHAGFDLVVEALHDGAVLPDAALACQSVRFDSHSEMRFATRSRTGMTLMPIALVNDFKMARGKFCRKFCNNRLANRHIVRPLWLQLSAD